MFDFKEAYKNTSIQTKQIVAFLLIGLIPLVILGVTSFTLSKKAIKDKVGTFSEQLFIQAVQNIDTQISQIEKTADIVQNNEKIISLLSRKESEFNFVEKISAEKTVDDLLYSIVFSDRYIGRVYLYRVIDGSLFPPKGSKVKMEESLVSFFEKGLFQSSELYQSVGKSLNKNLWITGLKSSYNQIFLMRELHDLMTNEWKGVLVFVIDVEQINEMYREIKFETEKNVFIVDNVSHVIVSSIEKKKIGNTFNHARMKTILGDKNGIIYDEGNLLSFNTCKTGWKLILQVSESFLLSEVNTIRINIIALLIIFTLSIIFASVYISKKFITEPILKLVAGTAAIGKGDFEYKVEIGLKDEIGKLADSFNWMALEIKESQETLNAMNDFLQNIINSISSILIVLDTKEAITHWNVSAEKESRMSDLKAVQKKIWEIFPYLPPYREKITKILNSGGASEFNAIIKSDVDNRYLDLHVYPLRYMRNTIGVVLLIDDITEIRKKEEQLQQAQKMETIGNLAGGLAHDFNNVLGGIIGSISIMKYRISSPSKDTLDHIEKLIDTIEISADRAANMVKQLLSLSRREELTLVPVDLNLTLKHVYKICKSSFDKSIEIIVNYQKTPAMIMGDPTQMEQILLNLCVNASHAMTIMRKSEDHMGGTLKIDIEEFISDVLFSKNHPEAEEKQYFILRVSDTGIGMESKTIAKIFEPFFTTKGKEKGTGLGLSMVYNIVKQHGGFIDVYSEFGIGTAFTVYLPKAIGQGDNVDDSKEETPPVGSGNILVIDDETTIRKTAKAILEECGYNVMDIGDGQVGIDIFRERHRDIRLVILDMSMPKISGKEIYIEMKKIDPNLKILISSGYMMNERIKEIMALGVNGFIQKPYSMISLAKKIKEITG